MCEWDTISEQYHLEKIKTIGDCYMLAGGIPQRTLNHPEMVMEFAIEMLESLERFNKVNGHHLQVRIGINTGSVVAGVIGKKKMAFDLWGGTRISIIVIQ